MGEDGEGKIMSTQTPMATDDPRMIAWNALKQTEEYQNTVHWTIEAKNDNEADGVLWFAFLAGHSAASTRDALPFNINHYVRVKLTDHGRGLLAQMQYAPPFTEDADGWSEWQLWELMRTFGPHVYMGGNLVFETVIEIKI